MAAKLYWLLKDRKVSWIIRPGVNQIIRNSSSVAANNIRFSYLIFPTWTVTVSSGYLYFIKM
ncbi:MAG: hypothetical protein WCP32_12760 [Bacteroidota bacterium]